MKRRSIRTVLGFLAAAAFLTVSAASIHAAHTGGNVILTDRNGRRVTAAAPAERWYSPKRTCGTATCHQTIAFDYGLSVNIYEDDASVGLAVKNHGPGTIPYSVPFPINGVSAGFHFQQGRNLPWGDEQRRYYGMPPATSSPGMYGKYFSTTHGFLADLNETDPAKFDMSSYDFSHSPCVWCHPGGGPFEYDRDGYRYDDGLLAGLGLFGFNPDSDTRKGDYYAYDAATNSIVSRVSSWQTGGVGEIDCLMCHFTRQYTNLERNYAPLAPTVAPKYAASLGLVGAKGQAGLLAIGQKGLPGVNPNIDPVTWVWQNIGAGTGLVPATAIDKVPPKESCAVCHFPDGSWTDLGPAGVSLGRTAFQAHLAPNSVRDADKVGSGNNSEAWTIAFTRVEASYRGESINDGNNPDVHMDRGLNCSYCHNTLGPSRFVAGDPGLPNPDAAVGTSYPPLTDSAGVVIQPGVTVRKIDHQFAKGVNTAANMDQLDGTVSCESCHVTRTHPNAEGYDTDGDGAVDVPRPAPNPTTAHAGFPAFHFARIDCRSCHIPALNGPVKQVLADYTVGPYRNAFRSQTIDGGAAGIGYRPLYLWLPTAHDRKAFKIQPVTPLVAAEWDDRLPDGTLIPTFQRVAQAAAEDLRSLYGDADGNGVYDWTLNSPQGGDTSLIVNTPTEIAGMVSQLKARSVSEPVMRLDVNYFEPSHNVATKASGKILGSSAGGGCVMCHGSSDPSSPNFSTKASGFFDKIFTLFNQPADGGNGLVQTELSGIKRVDVRFKVEQYDGTRRDIDLSNANGEEVGSTLRQGDVLGFTPTSSPYSLAYITDPAAAGLVKPVAAFSWSTDNVVSRQVNFDAPSSTCGGICTYFWDFGDSANDTGISVSHQYGTAGLYPVTLTVADTQYGMSSSTTVSVEAKTVNTAPVASKTAPSVSGMTVSFTDTSTDKEDLQASLSVLVQWGDGTTSTGVGGGTFTKTYGLGGTYTIKHSVTDTGGLTSSSANASVTIAEKYSISGTVTEAGAGLAGATVYLKQGTTTKRTVSTAADGTYSFANLLKGCYSVQPGMTGKTFTPVQQTVCVGPSKTGIDFASNP